MTSAALICAAAASFLVGGGPRAPAALPRASRIIAAIDYKDPAVAAEFQKVQERPIELVEAEIEDRVRTEYGAEPRLVLELESVYERFFLPRVRGGRSGSKKRYAGQVDGQLELVGLVRTGVSFASTRYDVLFFVRDFK